MPTTIKESIDGRAITPVQKVRIIIRVLVAWLRSPHQRLGQLVDNAVTCKGLDDCFYIEDEDLAEAIEAFVKEVMNAE